MRFKKSMIEQRWPAGLHDEPALGAHLATLRFGYTHHGIYVGSGKVVHYSGLSCSWHSGPVEEVTLARFALDHTVRIVDHPEPMFCPEEVVTRARSRVGERDYRVLTNNCEHFCNWCVSGLSRSIQIERPSGIPALTLCLAVRLVSRRPQGRVGERVLATDPSKQAKTGSGFSLA
jgi:hypothetical protein